MVKQWYKLIVENLTSKISVVHKITNHNSTLHNDADNYADTDSTVSLGALSDYTKQVLL